MDVFTVLADPTRRRLLDEMLDGERTVGELVGAVRASQPTVSKHLRVLRDAGLVARRVDAQHRRYRLAPEGLHEVDKWIDAYRRLWAGRLDRLEAHLDTRSRRD